MTAENDEPTSREELERRLPADMLAECDELLAIAEAVEPVVADLAERFYALCKRWDEGHGDLPNGDVDPRMLEASGSDRIGALLGAIVARSMGPASASTTTRRWRSTSGKR